jgi:hypothetical protein
VRIVRWLNRETVIEDVSPIAKRHSGSPEIDVAMTGKLDVNADFVPRIVKPLEERQTVLSETLDLVRRLAEAEAQIEARKRATSLGFSFY